MRPRPRPRHAAAALALLALGTVAAGAGERALDTFDAWTAMAFDEEGGARACMMWSQPSESAGEYTERGEAFAFVAHRPAEQRRDKVSFEAGYPFDPGSEVTVTVGEREFTLFTDGTIAWTYAEADDRALVEAMRGGREMVVEGRSKRGTDTRDTYSLIGFTAAHRAIGEACGGD